MRCLLEGVQNYLETPKSSHAIMITGGWGTGKTYFWRNELEPLVSSQAIPENTEKKYKPLYISLFGVDDVREINKKIFFETCAAWSFLDSTWMKGLKGIGRKLISSFEYFGVADKLLNEVSDLKIDYKKLADLNEYVFCFDDLERAKVDIEEILGYINQLVEHDNIKTIVIANEEEITKVTEKNMELKTLCAICSLLPNDQEHTVDEVERHIRKLFEKKRKYNFIKEKVIGKTYHYRSDISKVLKNLIDENFSNEEFSMFLKAKSVLILDILSKAEDGGNIRILNQTLQDYFIIYKTLTNMGERFKVLADKIFVPMLIFSFEFRLGKLSKEGALSLCGAGIIHALSWGAKKKTETETETDKFILKYSDNLLESSIIPNSVMNFIVSGYFDKDAFTKEAKRYLPVEKSTLDLFFEAISCFNDELLEKTSDIVLQEVVQGKYGLQVYYQLFKTFAVLSQEQIIDKRIPELKSLFIQGLDAAGTDTYDYPYQSIAYFSYDSPEANEIKAYVEKRFEELEKQKRVMDLIEKIKNLPENISDFCTKISNGDYRTESIFNEVDIEALFAALLRMSPEHFLRFAKSVHLRYRIDNIKLLAKDFDGLSNLMLHIHNHRQSINPSLQAFQFKLLYNELHEIIERLRCK